jgi:hypothetical protein
MSGESESSEIGIVEAQLRSEKEVKENAADRIRNELEEKFVINVNGKRKGCQDGAITKRLRWAMASTKARAQFPELETATVVDAPPAKDPAKLIDDPMLSVRSYASKVWHDYCPQVNITIDPPGDKLLTTERKAILRYLEQKNIRFETLEEYVQVYHAHQDTFNDHSNAPDLLRLVRLCDNVLNGVKLTPYELFDLMGGGRHVIPEALKVASQLLLYHVYRNK